MHKSYNAPMLTLKFPLFNSPGLLCLSTVIFNAFVLNWRYLSFLFAKTLTCSWQTKLQALLKSDLTTNHYYFCRTVNLWRTSQTLPSMFTLLVTSGFMGVMSAVVVGISPSMAPSAALLAPLTVRSTCKPARTMISTVTAILKVTVITSTRERCEWDSGLEAATLATKMLTRTRVGRQCPGFSLKRFQKLSSNHVTLDDSLDFLEKPWYSSFAVVLQTFVSTDSKLLYQLKNKAEKNYETAVPLL